MVKMKLTGADIPALLYQLSNKGIVMHDLCHIDPLTVTFCVADSQQKSFNNIIKRLNCSVTVLTDRSVWNLFRSLKRRYIFLSALVLLIFLSCWLPGRILFIQIVGNNGVSSAKILQQAERCGIHFGAKRSVVRSEIVKNNLLESMPELRWAGINTRGCTAVIIVQENTATEESADPVQSSSIVASRDGIILSVTATAGYPACSVGQAVVKDQVLISGNQTEGILLKTVRSKGEIYAQTVWELRAITPLGFLKKEEIVASSSNYSLVVGKNRIKLSKHSGISPTGCDKMYEEYYLTLPGGFVLPVCLAVETVIQYSQTASEPTFFQPEVFLGDYAASYLPTQMISGLITGKRGSYQQDQLVGVYEASYTCIEMIGRERPEELDFYYGKDH